MSKIQAAQVIVKLPILPIQKQEMKMEKTVKAEPVSGSSTEQPAAEEDFWQCLIFHQYLWLLE